MCCDAAHIMIADTMISAHMYASNTHKGHWQSRLSISVKQQTSKDNSCSSYFASPKAFCLTRQYR